MKRFAVKVLLSRNLLSPKGEGHFRLSGSADQDCYEATEHPNGNANITFQAPFMAE